MFVVSSQMIIRGLVNNVFVAHMMSCDQYTGILQEAIIYHQVKYLGLMENLRVRRAGFCYRRPFAVFLGRYKSLCPKTWPTWRG